MTEPSPAPRARRDPVHRTVHGRELIDEHAWMLDTGSAPMREHLAAEHRYALSELASVESLQRRIRAELDMRHVENPPRRR